MTTATRPYTRHEACTHEDSKKARRQCRNTARRSLADHTVKDLQGIAREAGLRGRSSATKDELVYRLSFDPQVRSSN